MSVIQDSGSNSFFGHQGTYLFTVTAKTGNSEQILRKASKIDFKLPEEFDIPQGQEVSCEATQSIKSTNCQFTANNHLFCALAVEGDAKSVQFKVSGIKNPNVNKITGKVSFELVRFIFSSECLVLITFL